MCKQQESNNPPQLSPYIIQVAGTFLLIPSYHSHSCKKRNIYAVRSSGHAVCVYVCAHVYVCATPEQYFSIHH